MLLGGTVPCKINQIRNPSTNRCVLRTGRIGVLIESKRSPKTKSPKPLSSKVSESLKDIVLKNYQSNYVNGRNEDYFFQKCESITETFGSTWKNMMILNFAFLHNLFFPFYHRGFLIGGHAAKSDTTLLRLHKLGIFTHDGHGNNCDYIEQERSYIDSIIYLYSREYEELITKALTILKKDKRIYVTYLNTKTNEYFNNLKYDLKINNKDRYGLNRSSKDRTNVATTVGNYTREEILNNFLLPPSKKFLGNIIILSIYAREYCGSLADLILLETFNKLHAQKIFDDPFENN